MTERARAVKPHQVGDREPLAVVAGDRVEIGPRDTTWPAFVLVTTATGGQGWVPSRLLSQDSGTAEVLGGYDTTELETAAGDLLQVLDRDDDSGWWWCRATDGREGWVPIRTLDPHVAAV